MNKLAGTTGLGALLWGSVSVVGLVLGALIGGLAPLTHRLVAGTMAVAAGMLLAAASVGLAGEALLETTIWAGGGALLLGAGLFSAANAALAARGAGDRKRCGECVAQPPESERPGSGVAIAVGTAMDAVPEALVLGLSLRAGGPDPGLILAIALGNLPEALSSSTGMRAAGRPLSWILTVWGSVAAGTVLLTLAGFLLGGELAPEARALLELAGAGALLSMATETLIPEAVHGSPRFAGTVAAAGFGLLLLADFASRAA